MRLFSALIFRARMKRATFLDQAGNGVVSRMVEAISDRRARVARFGRISLQQLGSHFVVARLGKRTSRRPPENLAPRELASGLLPEHPQEPEKIAHPSWRKESPTPLPSQEPEKTHPRPSRSFRARRTRCSRTLDLRVRRSECFRAWRFALRFHSKAKMATLATHWKKPRWFGLAMRETRDLVLALVQNLALPAMGRLRKQGSGLERRPWAHSHWPASKMPRLWRRAGHSWPGLSHRSRCQTGLQSDPKPDSGPVAPVN